MSCVGIFPDERSGNAGSVNENRAVDVRDRREGQGEGKRANSRESLVFEVRTASNIWILRRRDTSRGNALSVSDGREERSERRRRRRKRRHTKSKESVR